MNKKKTIIILLALFFLLSIITVYAGCSTSIDGTKGDCEYGQVCVGGECEWADRDFDGYPNFDFCRMLPGGGHNCDCDDYDPEVHPGAPERCNYKDDNCNGVEVTVDEDSCKQHSFWTYHYGYRPFMANCGRKEAIHVGGGCEAGGGAAVQVTDRGNTLIYSCPPASGHQDNVYVWKCCTYSVTETGEGVDEGVDTCRKTVYLCDEEEFFTTSQGGGEDMSTGYCDGETWCVDVIGTRDTAQCEYEAEEEFMGVNQFNTYFCDKTDCYKFVGGEFQVCGYGWNCAAVCFPGDCQAETKEWCNDAGIWQTEGWCHSDCGRADSDCGGNCEPGACDTDAGLVCDDDGYWTDENYCDCDVCGSVDAGCGYCTCTEGDCDIVNDKYCEAGIWTSEYYCLSDCCEKDYKCYQANFCDSCNEGSCDLENNMHCSGGVWTSEEYCNETNCGPYDYDCGSKECENGRCDTVEKLYCENGRWIKPGASYCFPGYCGTRDPLTCGCSNEVDQCCKGADDLVCDPDCTVTSDPDCDECLPDLVDDCCNYDNDGTCDPDCIPGFDPDCQTTCQLEDDDCCSGVDDAHCDPDCTETSDQDCTGICTTDRGDCCVPDQDNVCDPDCIPGVDPNCAAAPCEENWVCNEWDSDCDGVNDQHTCLDWEDKNDCNTFFDKPDDLQNCYKEYTCEPGDDTDGDGYTERACYDAVNEVVLEDLDCDDDDASQNPEAEEVCNGEDDNCDESVDEGCPCQEGTQPCGRDEGICKQGIQMCVGGYWSVCGGSGYIGPQKEECDDGLDNNCDGYVDEGCGCEEGDTQECGTDQGICEKGWQGCYEGVFGSFCNNETKGTEEVCDNELDDDCDGYIDGDDSSCQVKTPVIAAPDHCTNRMQDEDEEGSDCGGSCPYPCTTEVCEYGKIEEKCKCGSAVYRTGYCCNGKYSIAACAEEVKDSDDDGCTDDQEFALGTNIYNDDTDGDGMLDCDPLEAWPLCNEDGLCDSERDFPETPENCPTDCVERVGVGFFMWLMLILIILALIGVGGYLYAKSKGYKLSDFIKLKKKKEAPKFQYFPRGVKKPLPAKPAKPAEIKPEAAKPAAVKPVTAVPKKKSMVQLRAFVNSSLRKGYTKLQIRKTAMEAGWTKEEIDKALKGKKSQYKLLK